MAKRPEWELQEAKDLEVLLRIATEPTYERSFYEDELDEAHTLALGNLHRYGFVRRASVLTQRVDETTCRVIRVYRLTPKGKRAYLRAIEGFEWYLPKV